MQLAREPAALVLADRLQVLRELAQLCRARRDFLLETVALAGDALRLGGECAVEGRGLAQVHEQRQQAERGHRRDADPVQPERLVDAAPTHVDLLALEPEQPLAEYAQVLHLLAADVGEDELAPGSLGASVVHLDRRRQLAQLGLGLLGELWSSSRRCADSSRSSSFSQASSERDWLSACS